ncbi:MAG: uncharacterized protein H6Q37_614 [Chloroflexi bacterium]|nr:uncharacterized protein [Chloroflexota bacterium]
MFEYPVVDYEPMNMDFPPSNSLILVVLLNKPRDFEIARLLGWYRIPLRSAPKVIGVDFLAFYQTAAFENEKWRISYIAPVRGHELTTRQELLRDEPDHPRAQQEYYKIQIGPLQRLPEPILAGEWRRITFLYTTGEYLHRAKIINDLVVQSDERQTLWRALRERDSSTQIYATQENQGLELSPEVLATLLGISGYS